MQEENKFQHENEAPLASETITSHITEEYDVSKVLTYKAITKEPVMPTRQHGIGKIMIEIIDVYLLSNTILMRDWVICYDETGNETYRQIINDIYPKLYSDEQLSAIFMNSGVNLKENLDKFYTKVKEVVDVASLLVNQYDPPYGLKPNSFEKYIETA